MKILLTNDDSHQSPLLLTAIEFFRELGELTVVVPKHEQSWKGKSITRFSKLHREDIELGGYPCHTLDGTPADCVNFGIYNLFSSKPDLIISGINAGVNAGVGFVFSSGTVGACFEANIASLPAIALSQVFDTATRNNYVADYSIAAPLISRFRSETRSVLERLMGRIFSPESPLTRPITLNVNIPFALAPEWRFVAAPLAQSLYGSLFKPHELGFTHQLVDIYHDPAAQNDRNVVLEGNVSITPLDITRFGQPADEEIRNLDKLLSI